MSKDERVAPGRDVVKKVYLQPGLVVYGPISKLTQGGNPSASSDHGQNMMSMELGLDRSSH